MEQKSEKTKETLKKELDSIAIILIQAEDRFKEANLNYLKKEREKSLPEPELSKIRDNVVTLYKHVKDIKPIYKKKLNEYENAIGYNKNKQ